MSQTTAEPILSRVSHHLPHPSRGKWLLVTVLVILGILAIPLGCLIVRWPFTYAKVSQDLSEATGSRVEMQHFRQLYLPRPGCVAEQLTFRRGSDSNAPPVMTIKRLVIRSSILGLFGKHVQKIVADGVHVIMPPLGTQSGSKPASDIVVGDLVAKNAVFEFEREDKSQPRLKFLVHRLSLQNFGRRTVINFYSSVRIPEPPGEAVVRGTLGPFKANENPEAPLAGTYTFNNADLGDFKAVGGILSSTGKFQGKLNHLEVEGETSTPDFRVQESNHKVALSTKFQALVNTVNGDVQLHNATANFWKTTLLTQGDITGANNPPEMHGKVTSLDMLVREGRIQDLMMLFVKAPHSPLTGTVSLHARAFLPPGEGEFLKKLRMEGDFGIDSAHFTNPGTQQGIGVLSESARGKPPGDDEKDKEKVQIEAESLVSDLKGHIILRNGVATFTDLSFGVPGAHAEMHGTYDLISERINMAGVLIMQAKLSDATSGIKSFLVKALSPFLKNNHPREPLPVTITGTYDHPSYHVTTTPKK